MNEHSTLTSKSSTTEETYLEGDSLEENFSTSNYETNADDECEVSENNKNGNSTKRKSNKTIDSIKKRELKRIRKTSTPFQESVKDLKKSEEDSLYPIRYEQQRNEFCSSMDSTFELTEMEADKHLNVQHFSEVEFTLKRRREGHIAAFIKKLEPNWEEVLCSPPSDKNLSNGTPLILVICEAASRSMELIVNIKEFGKFCKIGKLFAKRVKINEQSRFLCSNPTSIVVGTPNRMTKLSDMGSLKLYRLKHVIIDISYRNAKNFNILEQHDTRVDLLQFYRKHLSEWILSGQAKFCFF